jgi:exopolysaccharide production protein ExoQ
MTATPAHSPYRTVEDSADTRVSRQVLSWLLFWPMLTLIARQSVYFSGPSPTFEMGQYGASMGAERGSHAALYVFFLFMLGFVLVSHRQVWAVVKTNLLIPAVLAFAVCSAFWSVSPTITLQMSMQVGLCTLFACYLSARFTAERLMEFLIFMGVASALLSMLFVIALPSYGLHQGEAEGAWQGICDHKNSFGISMAFLLSPVFFTSSYSRGRKLMYTALLLFLIYKSQSRGAWADTAGMLLFVGWLSLIRRARTRELRLLLFVTIAAGVVTTALAVHFWPVLAVAIGKDPSGTGRADIYTEVFRSIMKRPIQGYGLWAFWAPHNVEAQRIRLAIRWPNIGYAENGILELALQVGILGAGLVLAMITRAFFQGARLLRSSHYSPQIGWFLTILFLAALTNIDAGWFMTANTLDWVLILVSCIGMNAAATRYPRLTGNFES